MSKKFIETDGSAWIVPFIVFAFVLAAWYFWTDHRNWNDDVRLEIQYGEVLSTYHFPAAYGGGRTRFEYTNKIAKCELGEPAILTLNRSGYTWRRMSYCPEEQTQK